MKRANLLMALLCLLFIFSCKKNDHFTYQDYQAYQQQSFFTDPVNATKEIKEIINDLKRREKDPARLAQFIELNGIPLWDLAISDRRNNEETSEDKTEIVFIPLKSAPRSDIRSYIVCYKGNERKSVV